ncbi:N-formylglutamate amidohydrolase [Paenibacillus sp. CC-CFT747]|nr:N-formylglutamate amidohydrolase [Paenibacillus sp. CC-CFT747]
MNSSSNILVSIPHGSSHLTDEMITRKKQDIILANTDWYLNELYSFLDDLPLTVVSANYSRYVIDVNRAIECDVGEDAYTTSLVYRKTTFGKLIYDSWLSEEVINNRIETIYNPFHYRLKEEINAVLENQRTAYLFDLHSFYIQSTADVVLGTCGGRSCSSEFAELVSEAFTVEGFDVRIDEQGLTGGYITSHYGSLDRVEAIQIELRYTTYIENRAFGEEVVTTRNESLFRDTQARLLRVFSRVEQKLAKT